VHNIEIKVPLPERPAVERRLEELGAQRQWARRQRDTFFEVVSGWLKLREAEGAGPELIAYQRSTAETGPRPSEYEIAALPDAELWKRLLGRVLPQEVVVAKERTLWLYRHTRIHLDRVDDLGDYLELETVAREIDLAEAREESDHVIEALHLDRSTFLARPYRDLLQA
jgi:predicted adenylyl cyclase CyaB